MNAEILHTYGQLASQYQALSDSGKKQLKLLALARFICFTGIFPAWYYIHPLNNILALLVSSLLLTTFFILIKKFIQTEKQQVFNQQLVEINRNEIEALKRNYTVFDPGNEFIDPHHDYSYDLDLYGSGSFFQFLNRTVTNRGKKHLASILNHSNRPSDEIRIMQAAVDELAKELNWRQYFLAKGKETEDEKKQNQIDDSIRQQITLKSANNLKYILIVLPPITLVLIGLYATGLIIGSFYLIAVFMQWAIFILYSKTISKFHRQFESQAKLLVRYADMLQQIENINLVSSYWVSLKEKLSSKGKTASVITSELQSILNQFDYRQNILVGFVLNSVLLWDVRCLSKLYRWQQNYKTDLPRWFEVIAEMDALISLANCNYNHPEWTAPTLSGAEFRFEASEMGHPLIDETRCVRNSFQIIKDEQIVIITGANMAGKSTFLRTVGINLILASTGCKVCAESFCFSPVRLYTNMRTSDNLMNDESYFYAELLRLQTLLNLLRKGENLLVIIDEMLKGTNSTDKLNGSKALINQLIALNTHGIVATHDLSLTDLSTVYPSSIKNQCFEVQLHDDELTFDYKLSNGVTRTMNATFLMKKMGIIP